MSGHNRRPIHHRQAAARAVSPNQSALSSFISSVLAQATVPPAPPAVTPTPNPPAPIIPSSTMPATTTKPAVKSVSKSKAPAATKSVKASAKPAAHANKGPSPAVIGVVVTICLLVALGVGAFFLRKRLIKKRKQRSEEKWANRPRTTFINTDKPGGIEEEIKPYTDRLTTRRSSATNADQLGDAFGGPHTGVPYYAEKALPSPDVNHDLQVLSYSSPMSSVPPTPMSEKVLTPTLVVSLPSLSLSAEEATSPSTAPLNASESQLFFTTPAQPDANKTTAGYTLPASPPPVYNAPNAEPGTSLPNPHAPIASVLPAALIPGGANRDSLRSPSPANSAASLALPTMQAQRQGTEATMPSYTQPGSEIAQAPLQPLTESVPIPTSSSPTNTTAPYAYPVIRTFAPTLPDELRITTGERVRVLNSYDDGWALCENIAGQKGVVPLECLDLDLSGRTQTDEWRISRRASSLFGVSVNF